MTLKDYQDLQAGPIQEVQVKTLRDEFAMAALDHMNDSEYMSYEATAESAYRLADAMLEARKKGPK